MLGRFQHNIRDIQVNFWRYCLDRSAESLKSDFHRRPRFVAGLRTTLKSFFSGCLFKKQQQNKKQKSKVPRQSAGDPKVQKQMKTIQTWTLLYTQQHRQNTVFKNNLFSICFEEKES